MSETANISRISEKVADDIFCSFGWSKRGPMNQSWGCQKNAIHKRKRHVHPTDVVFSYDNPYDGAEDLLLFDLKSYGKTSFESAKFAAAINNLAQSVECARISEEWGRLYRTTGSRDRVNGVLFIFQHDEGTIDFPGLISGVKSDELLYDSGTTIRVIGPDDVRYLWSVANDIKLLRSDTERIHWKPQSSPSFYHPHLLRRRAEKTSHKSAAIENVCGPFIPMHGRLVIDQREFNAHVVYYRDKCESQDEFLYLIDYCFRFQLVRDDVDRIVIKVLAGRNDASALFDRALDGYIKHYYSRDGIQEKVKKDLFDKFKLLEINTVSPIFSPISIGMEDR